MQRDRLCDPTAGSASVLIAAMCRMFNDTAMRFKKDSHKLADKLEEIKQFQFHGVELQEELFAVGTTNMILRADGKGNFQRNSIFDVTRDGFVPYAPERPEHREGFTKVLMHPPYLQSKDKTIRHLSGVARKSWTRSGAT
nr:N-6 DNA methylase [Corynebacterium amycolatum]